MRIDILSLFPGYFKGPFDESILKRAKERGLVEINLVDIRSFSTDKWARVDDRPFGGGPGMVMSPSPVTDAIRSVKKEKSYVIGLSPQGNLLNAAKAKLLSQKEHLVLVCGHYEGIDQRVIDLEIDEELSIGDLVLTNGCLAAIVLVDSVVRFVPHVLGHEEAAEQDSFQTGLLEGAHYTRPLLFEGLGVPEVLTKGDHGAIKKWRLSGAKQKSAFMRPDLFTLYLEERVGPAEKSPRLLIWVKELKRSLKFYQKEVGLTLRKKTDDVAVLDNKTCEVVLIEGLIESPQSPVHYIEMRCSFQGIRQDPDGTIIRSQP